MPKLETLFQNHLADLQDIDRSAEDIFICPICLNEYSSIDIKSEKLSRGDVWAKYVRDKSSNNSIKNQIVLLCKDCNSLTGQYGDAQMQLIEKIRDGEEKGELYGMRRMHLSRKDKKPILVNGNIKIDNDTKTITMSGKLVHRNINNLKF